MTAAIKLAAVFYALMLIAAAFEQLERPGNVCRDGWLWTILACPPRWLWIAVWRGCGALRVGLRLPPRRYRSRAQLEQRIVELEREVGL